MTDFNVYVTGGFGDAWLSALYGGAIGPSPTPYKMQGKLIETYQDGSALIEGSIRIWDGMVDLHDDGSRCQCYPCNQHHTREWACENKPTSYIVPAGYWQPAKRG